MGESFIRKTYTSRAARRSVSREDALCATAFSVLDTARDEEEIRTRLHATVFGTDLFAKIPKFRRAYLAGYCDGARDMRARREGHAPAKQLPAQHVRVPRWVERMQPGATWRRHPLGGGWVSHTAYVESTAYVGPSVVVFDRARVLENAKLQGEGTRVFGDAEVWGQAQVFGGALIHGDTQLCDRCRVSGVELEYGRVEGATELRQKQDLRILSAKRAETVLPPPGFVVAATN